MRIVEKAYTFDNVLLVPAHPSVLPQDIKLQTKLACDIMFNLPLLSAAMDAVTEARLVISMTQEGGIGIIHKDMTPESQARAAPKVKHHGSGVMKDPVTVAPTALIRDILEMHAQCKHEMSGLPVVENGKAVSIVTNRDLCFESRIDLSVSAIMTPRNHLVTVPESTNIDGARKTMHTYKVERALVSNDQGELKGLTTVKDILKTTEFPNTSKDAEDRLRVSAAIGTDDDAEEHIKALAETSVDVIVVDTTCGHGQDVIDRMHQVKETYPHIQVIGGNIVTTQAALDLAAVGTDTAKVGIGPGLICTTRIMAGVGVPQLAAIRNVSKALKDTGIPPVVDGDTRFSGDIAKALAAGAYSVMLGGMFAGMEEAPGEIELYQGRSYKSYRGMGSLGAMSQGSADHYFQDRTGSTDEYIPEGIEGRMSHKGLVVSIIHQSAGSLCSNMGYLGCTNTVEIYEKAEFVEITSADMSESHVHGVQITKETPSRHR